jgi:hypothetical protein
MSRKGMPFGLGDGLASSVVYVPVQPQVSSNFTEVASGIIGLGFISFADK